MPELRKDPVTSRWVIIATERAQRPSDFGVEPEISRGGFCPFCPGFEGKTPREVMAYRPNGSLPDTPGWWVRVVPNKFPALMIEGGLGKVGYGMFDRMNGIGAHEVIIETPRHEATLSSLTEKEIVDVFWAYRDRIIDLSRDNRFQYILVFKNHGSSAGASLEHSHSQLIALPIVPKQVMEELSGSADYYRYKDRCVFCDMVTQESTEGTRVIYQNEDFLVVAPYSSRFPFEIWVLPKYHNSSYVEAQKIHYERLANAFSISLKKLDRALNKPPYNFILHTAPIKNQCEAHYHWHFEIMPKLTKVAGFEWGSGFYINPTPPEEAAKFLCDLEI
ncbi:MAG: galactose-1-phosphate uridylyltransferase [Nitrospinae bacterium RIFCSPLOWO2_12_FULL_45_22]|nr:MAG: galactose-1-phosphate uridylyltransferase [Nitrospinae bacterium RIFCSPLOWO2_12_FULL_45_22]